MPIFLNTDTHIYGCLELYSAALGYYRFDKINNKMIEVKYNTDLLLSDVTKFKRCLGLEMINKNLLLLEAELLHSDLSSTKVSVQVIDLTHKNKVKSFKLESSVESYFRPMRLLYYEPKRFWIFSGFTNKVAGSGPQIIL